MRQRMPDVKMQGSPDAPRCGFSAQVVQALRAAGAHFSHFDILQDHAIREGLKVPDGIAAVHDAAHITSPACCGRGATPLLRPAQ